MSRELYHHGILGMKWGIRRFQNADGTLTKAGKQRYRTDGDSDVVSDNTPQEQSNQSSSDTSQGYKINAGDVRRDLDSYTTQDLQNAVTRLNLQSRVGQLAKEEGRKPHNGSYNVTPKQLQARMGKMSDQELKDAIERIGLQKKVADLQPKKTRKVEKFLDDVTSYGGKTAAAIGAVVAVKAAIDSLEDSGGKKK